MAYWKSVRDKNIAPRSKRVTTFLSPLHYLGWIKRNFSHIGFWMVWYRSYHSKFDMAKVGQMFSKFKIQVPRQLYAHRGISNNKKTLSCMINKSLESLKKIECVCYRLVDDIQVLSQLRLNNYAGDPLGRCIFPLTKPNFQSSQHDALKFASLCFYKIGPPRNLSRIWINLARRLLPGIFTLC